MTGLVQVAGSSGSHPVSRHRIARHSAAVRAEKRSFDKVPLADGVAARVRDAALEKVRAAYTKHDKHERYGQLSQIKKEVVAELCAEGQPFAGKEKDV